MYIRSSAMVKESITMQTQLLASFATRMRAESLFEDLCKAGIQATIVQPKWTNKRLPPPKVEVLVSEADYERALEVYKAFRK